MKAPKLPLQSFRLRNFKAVQDSGLIRLTPLTVLIGNNGSGKSSLIEGLEMLHHIVMDGIDEAMEPWRGIDHIWNKAVSRKVIIEDDGGRYLSNPISFTVKGLSGAKPFWTEMNLTMDAVKNKVFIKEMPFFDYEELRVDKPFLFPKNYLLKVRNLTEMVEGWQFLSLVPQNMLYPLPQKRTYGKIILAKDGSNIAEYLQSIRDLDDKIFQDIVDTFRQVLPYADDLQPALTSELERNFYLSLTERNISQKLPGWLLSQGTLRILGLLSLFRHPKPPSVIIIEEIENGLDPRTIHLLVDEIQAYVQSGLGQIIVTTHSPYFLDLVPLSQIIVVERDEKNSPKFRRPADDQDLKMWAEKFAPGKLYTMGSLNRG